MCFSKRHWEGIFRGQSCVWVWQGCCACSMNQMPSDDVLYRNIYTQGTEKGLEGAPGIIKLSSWLPQALCPNSQYEFADRTRYSHLPLAPQPHDTAHHMQAGCPAPLPVCESCFLTLHLLTEPLRLSCVPEKPLKGQAVLFPKLSTELYKQDLYTLLLLQLHLFVLLFPRPLLKHLRCQFPRVDPHFTSFTACPMPRALSSLISSLPHIRAFHSFASLVTRVVTWTLLLQKCSVFSDFCLPHPRWLQHQLHGPKVIQKRQEVMSHNLWHWYLHFPLFAFTVKGAGMGYHPDTAHISSVNYKQENLVAVGSSQKQPRCFPSAGPAPQVVLRAGAEAAHSSLGSALCMAMNSKVTRNAETLGVTHKGWLCQMSWEHLSESRHQSHTAHGKKISPKA